jgi:ABC-type multidrug transport system fused ATPase/permease subunit
MRALGRLMAGRTTLVVSHKLSLIERADHILVFDRGRLVETGTSAQLLQAGGFYARLQAAGAGDDDAIRGATSRGHP